MSRDKGMQQAQMEQFSKRISRIEQGGPNTCQTVYTGVQTVETRRGKAVSGVSRGHDTEAQPTRGKLLARGLFSGVLKLILLALGLVIFLKFTGA